jgi:hypothetical protein
MSGRAIRSAIIARNAINIIISMFLSIENTPRDLSKEG